MSILLFSPTRGRVRNLNPTNTQGQKGPVRTNDENRIVLISVTGKIKFTGPNPLINIPVVISDNNSISLKEVFS